MTDRRPYDVEDDLGDEHWDEPATVWDDTGPDEYGEYGEYDHRRDDGYGPPRGGGRYLAGRGGGSRGGRRVRPAHVLLGVALVFVLLVGALFLWVQRQIDPPGGPGVVVTVEVPQDATSSEIGDLLADQGIITRADVWDWYLRVNGGGPFQAGIYELAEDSAMGDVVDQLSEGPRPPDERRYTMPEGFTQPETIARLADPERGLGLNADVMQQLLDSGQIRSEFQPVDEPSNEGILFPETYLVDAQADERAVLQQMVDELDATMRGLEVESAQERFNLTPYEILIVASLIEEETKVAEERPMVAQVIYNRIRQGIPLGIDATSRYEAELDGRDRSDIDFQSNSPYNTRRVKGLPPTPIAAPGRASIEAALNPADGPWTFYVLEDAEGNHFFTDSNAEFLEAKRRCRDNGLGCG